MNKHLYCCQNTIQNVYDHIIPVPDDFNVNPACLSGMEKQDFISGLKELTNIIKSVYADMIQKPAEYGLPLIEDIEYTPFNPKAAESKNSSHRLVALLHTLVQCSELSDFELKVNDKSFSEACKKLKPMNKVTNSKMIFKKLHDFGFTYDNNIFSYPDNNNVIAALYGYMKHIPLKHRALYSLNYFLAAADLPENHHQGAFAEYLSGNEREFYTKLNEFMASEGFVVGNEGDYCDFSFAVEYWIDSKSKKRIVRCYSDFGKLLICLKLHSSDCYDYYTESLPEKIKQIFRKASSCRFCAESCGARLTRTFEGVPYTDCGYMNLFDIADYDLNDIDYYKQLILLETKAVKKNARRKGIKVYL